MDIITAIRDKNLFRPYLEDKSGSIKSWRNWMCLLRVVYGLPLTKPWQLALVKKCTKRDPAKLPKRGFNRVLILAGRRSGKSRIAGLIAAYEATLSGRQRKCSPGEKPMVSVTSPTKDQSQVIRHYMRAALASDIFQNEITQDVTEKFALANGVTCRILTGAFRHTRAYTQLAVIVDEICFFSQAEESRVRSDTELIRSIKPALITTGGKLICASSKYRPSGWAYQQWKRHFGNNKSRTLVWDADSTTMNPTLSQADIDNEIKDDPVSARAEFLNVWRDDVSTYISTEMVERCTTKDRTQLIADPHINYTAFVDVSGGRQDSAALCIAHKKDDKVLLDYLREWPAPFSPTAIIRQMSTSLQNYNLRHCYGDAYAAQFVVDSFRSNNVVYLASEKSKSQLYLELLPMLCSYKVELLDNATLRNQLTSLERKCRAGGVDVVDHAAGEHDDVANVVAGAAAYVAKPKRLCGGWRKKLGESTGDPRKRFFRFARENNLQIVG